MTAYLHVTIYDLVWSSKSAAMDHGLIAMDDLNMPDFCFLSGRMLQEIVAVFLNFWQTFIFLPFWY